MKTTTDDWNEVMAESRKALPAQLVEYIAAVMKADESVQSYQPDLYNSVVAAAHGNPLPTY